MAQQQNGGGGYFPAGSSTFGLDLSGLYVGAEGSDEKKYLVQNPFTKPGGTPAPLDYSGFGRAIYDGLFGGPDANGQENSLGPATATGRLAPPEGVSVPGQESAQATSSFTLPALGPQGQFPSAPQYAAPNFQGALETLAGSGPSAPDYSVYQNVPQRQAPVAPNTAPDQKYLEGLADSKPEAPDKEARKDQNLVSILGALAAGAASGDGTTGGTLAAMGARGAQAFMENAERAAQEDREYQAARQQYNQALFQAEKSIAEQERQYQQAIRDTDYSNEGAMYVGTMRAEEARQRYASAVSAHRTRIAQLQMDAERAQAQAINRSLDAEYKNQVAQYEMDSKAAGYEFKDGNIVARVKNPDGSMTIKTTRVGQSGVDQLEQFGKALDVAGKFDKNGQSGAARKIASQSAMSLALERGDPSMALEVAAQSMAPNAQLYMADYEDELAKAQQTAQQQGILQGTEEYPQAINQYMTAQLVQMIAQNPDLLRGMAQTDPMAAVVYDKFYQPGG